MPNHIRDVIDNASAYRVSEEQTEKAKLLVCANSKDAEEAAIFLEELGLK